MAECLEKHCTYIHMFSYVKMASLTRMLKANNAIKKQTTIYKGRKLVNAKDYLRF